VTHLDRLQALHQALGAAQREALEPLARLLHLSVQLAGPESVLAAADAVLSAVDRLRQAAVYARAESGDT